MLLKTIAKYSPILMPLAAILGFLLPDYANALLPYLSAILFFLMFFTLLGLEQKALFKRLTSLAIWRFAVLHSGVFCLGLTLLAYLFGVRGDLLLAISAVAATAPLFGSGAVVNAVGFDALAATAKTITATLIMPLVLLVVLWGLAAKNAHLDWLLYGERLLIYIVMPIVLALVVKKILPNSLFTQWYPKIAQFNVLLLLAFPFGLVGGFRQTFDENPYQALQLFGLGCGLVLLFYFGAYWLYRKHGFENAIIAGVVSGGRNVLLTYIIATPFLGSLFLPLVGALQLPIFSLASLARYMVKKQQMGG